MEITTILAWIMIGVLTLYVGISTYLFGVLPTVSASAYEWKDELRMRWPFTAFAWIMAGLMIAIGEQAGNFHAIWTFDLAAVGWAFLGSAPWYKQKLPGTVHNVGVAVLIVASFLGVGMIFGHWWPGVSILGLGLASTLTKKVLPIPNRGLWGELVVAVLIFLGMIT